MAEIAPTLARPGVHPRAAAAAAVIGAALDLEAFRLTGGTALAWHLAHRVSEDLDFFTFTPGTLDHAGCEALVSALGALHPGSEAYHTGDRTVHGTVAGCRVSFFEVEGAWLDAPERVREGFAVASVAELSAMKLVAVMTRCARKDFYDLAAIAGSGVTLARMVECGRRMYPGFEQALGHLRRSLVYFDDAETDPVPSTLSGVSWPRVKEVMRALAAEPDR